MSKLIVNNDWDPNKGPVIQPPGVFRHHIHAPMTHWRAKITVPVGAVNAVILVKIHRVGHIRQIVAPT